MRPDPTDCLPFQLQKTLENFLPKRPEEVETQQSLLPRCNRLPSQKKLTTPRTALRHEDALWKPLQFSPCLGLRNFISDVFFLLSS